MSDKERDRYMRLAARLAKHEVGLNQDADESLLIDAAIGVRELSDKLAAATARAVAAEALQVYFYNQGYMAGHNDTVESCFTDIHHSDMTTYHADIVAELLQEQSHDQNN